MIVILCRSGGDVRSLGLYKFCATVFSRLGQRVAGASEFLLILIIPAQVLEYTKGIKQFYFNPSIFLIVLP